MRPRWKVIVELLVSIVAVLIGGSMVVRGLGNEPSVFPQWALVVGGTLVCAINMDRLEKRWKEL